MPRPNEKELSPSPISWENVLASLQDGVVVVDQAGEISFFNQAAEALTGLSASQAVKRPFARLFKKNPWLIDMTRKSQPPQQGSARGEWNFVNFLGQEIPVYLAVSPLQDRYGRFLGSILLLRDLTHQREIEEDLARSDRLALLGTMAAGLAHEIKNPLGGIRGAAQLLRRSLAQDSPLLEYTGIMIREVDRVNGLIEQLLDLSRPARLHLAPLNIHELLDDVLLLQKETASGGNFAIRKNYDPSLPAIRGDRARLTQVFLNLIKNGLEAMPGEGSLTITTRVEKDFRIRERGKEPGKYIRVEIEDQGVGIKEEDLPRIFSPFFTTKNNGTGLGLAISYRIIKEHNGFIRVESREGCGTAFKVSLLVAD